jgi:hypothetical protein
VHGRGPEWVERLCRTEHNVALLPGVSIALLAGWVVQWVRTTRSHAEPALKLAWPVVLMYVVGVAVMSL